VKDYIKSHGYHKKEWSEAWGKATFLLGNLNMRHLISLSRCLSSEVGFLGKEALFGNAGSILQPSCLERAFLASGER
jgi:hypothetical protein